MHSVHANCWMASDAVQIHCLISQHAVFDLENALNKYELWTTSSHGLLESHPHQTPLQLELKGAFTPLNKQE